MDGTAATPSELAVVVLGVLGGLAATLKSATGVCVDGCLAVLGKLSGSGDPAPEPSAITGTKAGSGDSSQARVAAGGADGGQAAVINFTSNPIRGAVQSQAASGQTAP
jgi:hypothetical protein